MDLEILENFLDKFKEGKISKKRLIEKFKVFPYENIDFARVDTHRSLRFGFPEVVYGPGKSLSHLKGIIKTILKHHSNVIITKVDEGVAVQIKKEFPDLVYFPSGRIVTLKKPEIKERKYICVLSAGTSDIPVAEESALTCEILGNRVKRIYDVGVAGLHRLLDSIVVLRRATCLIVVAGMEGALPSVVGGLVDKPVIGVPTSIGYGTSFKGISPLLTMLNSCTPNVVVVNIDNGFGAGFFAHLISNKMH